MQVRYQAAPLPEGAVTIKSLLPGPESEQGPRPDLKGKTALVTGAGQGIGRAVAEALAECQASVVLTARSEEGISSVSREIREAGGDAFPIRSDVSSSEQVGELFKAAGRVDILVNNAGVIQPIAPTADADAGQWAYNIAVNLDGVFYASREALRGMIENDWGRIINVSSGASRGGVVGWGAYSAAKAGVEALTRTIAAEVGDQNIRVNAIRPGIVDTDMQVEIRGSTEEQFGRENLQRFRSYKERGLLRDPSDAARLLLWLLTSEAAELNGEVLAIDDPEVASRIGLEPMGR